MDDIHVFIILFLALLFLCRISKEGFEVETEVETPAEGEKPVDEEPNGEEPAIVPPPVPKEVNGSFQGWDKRKVFSSPTAPNFGSLLELKEIEHLNKLFSNRNADPNVPSMPIDSQMPSLSEGSSVPNMLPPNNGGAADAAAMAAATADAEADAGAGAEVVELHMVYADWCGHSKNALGDFEKLVDKTDVKTSSGKTVKFVLTEEQSEGMEEFKGKVKGFPTYMVKDASGLSPVDVGDRSESAIVDAAQKL
tara:strand:- start:831 stop:1583 length:753 start_codon:yes stop_codon:yes gene_type:complete